MAAPPLGAARRRTISAVCALPGSAADGAHVERAAPGPRLWLSGLQVTAATEHLEEAGMTTAARDTSTPRGEPSTGPAATRERIDTGPPETADSGAVEAMTGLDMILVDGARGPLRRLVPPVRTTARFGASLVRRPDAVARRAGGLVQDLARIVAGRSDIESSPKDKRFADPAWSGNPLLRRAKQAHIAAARAAVGLVDDADLDWQDDERVRFSLTNLVDALAPSNVPPLNPLMWKAVIDTGGRNLLGGTRRFLSDVTSPPRVPSMVESDAFTVGEDLAVTPGAVVLRTPVFELIQYRPTTEQVRSVPLVVVPPTINKYYVTDLAPGRSIVEHYVAAGQQVFMISWRNPTAEHADWGIDDYGQAVLDAMDAAQEITGSDQVALQAFCSGGIITSMVLAHLAATTGLARVAAASFAVTVLDWDRAGTVGALMDPEAVREAVEKSREKGYLDGAMLAEVFAWLRPNDLIWNYWVNNYLQGKPPPAFDILFWNADTTRMTAGLHRDFIDIAVQNSLTEAGDGEHARHAGGPVGRGRRHLRHGGYRRPPVPLAVLLPDDAAARRGEPLRAVDQRAHRLAGQPADQPQGDVLGGGGDAGRPRALARLRREGEGVVVARLHDVARRAQRRRGPGPRGPRLPPAPRPRGRSGTLRP